MPKKKSMIEVGEMPGVGMVLIVRGNAVSIHDTVSQAAQAGWIYLVCEMTDMNFSG